MWTSAQRALLPEHLEIEFRLPGQNGPVRWLRGIGMSLRDDSGVISTVVGVNIDITAQKQAEAAWRDLNTTLILLFYAVS